MGALITVLYILEVLVSVMLIGIVLIQQSKSQGGLGALAGGQTESVFGAATGNVITKATVTLAAIFLANTLLLAILTSRAGDVAKAKTLADELNKGAQTSQTGEVPGETDAMGTDGADVVEEGASGVTEAAGGTDVEKVDPGTTGTDEKATDAPAE